MRSFFFEGHYGVDETDSRSPYEKLIETKDLKEIFTIGPEILPTGKDFHSMFFAPNIWPNEDLKKATLEYWDHVQRVRNEVMSWLAQCLFVTYRNMHFHTLLLAQIM